MFETAAVFALAFIAALFAYLTFKVDGDRVHLQILFLVVSLFFAASTIYAVSDFSLQSQTPILVNQTTDYTYTNLTADPAISTEMVLTNSTVTYVYENQTDYAYQHEWYMTHYGVLMILTTFVLLYLILLFIISVFSELWGTKRHDDDN